MTVAVKISRMGHEPAELRELAVGRRDAAQSRRLLAIARQQPRRCSPPNRDGSANPTRVGASVQRGGCGRADIARRPRSTTEAEQGADERVARTVIAGPEAATHHVVRWRCVDLRAEVARRFEVTVDERTIGKWLGKMRLTRLQPRPYHPKKDHAAEDAYKSEHKPIKPQTEFRLSIWSASTSRFQLRSISNQDVRASRALSSTA
jgi:hypothetical protein